MGGCRVCEECVQQRQCTTLGACDMEETGMHQGG